MLDEDKVLEVEVITWYSTGTIWLLLMITLITDDYDR